MLKVSVIIPVKNEEDDIGELLDNLFSQSMIPDEVVITDGGSKDRTKMIINEYMKKKRLIKLICLPHAFPGKARNMSIMNAKNHIIALTDADCKPDKNWLKELVKMFKEDSTVDVVFGMDRTIPKTFIEHCFMVATEPVNFRPSVASMALKKDIWAKVGGFPENLRTAEDAVFISRIQNLQCNIKYNIKAIIHWRTRTSLFSFFKQCYQYERGLARINMRIGFNIRKLIFYIFLFCMLWLSFSENSIFLILLTIAYLGWMFLTVKRHYKWFKGIEKQVKSYFILPVVIFVRDIATILGFVHGTFQRIINP